MKLGIAMSIGCLLVAGLSGCYNYWVRTGDKDILSDLGVDVPYACAPHPYFCTAVVWPEVALSRDYQCGLAAALAVEMWPFSVVDEACEIALDTVFLPVDLTYLLKKEDGEGGQGTSANQGIAE